MTFQRVGQKIVIKPMSDMWVVFWAEKFLPPPERSGPLKQFPGQHNCSHGSIASHSRTKGRVPPLAFHNPYYKVRCNGENLE
ncbi:hypothetical protein JTE90_026315 [Oedothorax gibbosus]|uniref:Uncharacterized protein n=1 Tax=Oedothorax gibbosus TaxID=931172 RepID=A0AAV6U5H3_9ARAC|nr:hypothetical protein JTE90_026315 [Oedothorax gibbosus]